MRFRLRFHVEGARHLQVLHERPDCGCGCGGGWDERAARRELSNVLARIRAGVWAPPRPEPMPEPAEATVMPTFHQYASGWLEAKVHGVLGDKPIDANTESDYRWRLTRHLLPFFAEYRLDAIDRELCAAFKAHKLKEAAELREALAAGADLRDRRGRRLRPLSAASLRKLIDTLAAILDDAIEDELIDRNPARGKRMRVRVPKPTRSFLEMDELVALLTAAEALDRTPAVPTALHSADRTRDRVARLAAAGRPPSAIASELGIARATVSYHLAQLGVANGRAYLGSGAIVEMLARAGLRVSELCDLRLRDVRLQPREAAHCRIVDAKTAAGIREVQLTPDLADRLTRHLARLACRRSPDRSRRLPVPERARRAHHAASASAGSSPRRAERRPRSSRRAGFRRCRRPPRTRCGAPTSRSRCWPTASTSSGS